ncbi:MAG: hexulose-6-phosphate synthase [Denitrovibrio sp.]|nr:MAG: hexulose-6-phosphate synthase [Denitrovibrio sp.]
MDNLTGKQKRTLSIIFKIPVQSNINWVDIEKLFDALGAEITEGRGSRVRVYLNGVRAVFHRPHPEKETDKGAVKSVQRFLIEAGVRDA